MKSGSCITDSYMPDRGDIVWLNFTLQTGHEQRGKRPALILSPTPPKPKHSSAHSLALHGVLHI